MKGRPTTGYAKEALTAATNVHNVLSHAWELRKTDVMGAIAIASDALFESKSTRDATLIAASNAMLGRLYHSLFAELEKAKNHIAEARQIYKRNGDIDAVLEMDFVSISADITSGKEDRIISALNHILQQRLTTPFSASPSKRSSPKEPRKNFFSPRSWDDRLFDRVPPFEKQMAYQDRQIASIYNSLARAYDEIGDSTKSIEYLERQLELYRKHREDHDIAIVLNNLASVHSRPGSAQQALGYVKEAIRINRRLGNGVSLISNLHNLSNIYFGLGRVSAAKRTGKQVLERCINLGFIEQAARIRMMLAEFELKYGSLKLAREMNREVVRVLKPIGRTESLMNAFVQEQLIQYQLVPHPRIVRKMAALYAQAKKQGMQIQHEVSEELAKMALELGMEEEGIRWSAVVEKHKQEEQAKIARNEKKRTRIEQEVERLRQRDSESKSKLLEAELLMVRLAKSNSSLATLASRVQTIKQGRSAGDARVLEEVLQLIETMRHRDEEYEKLEEGARLSHREFILSLSKAFPNLTAAERRVCILIRLGLSSRDIASALFVSIRTIERHRLNIRHKMSLGDKVLLAAHLGRL